MHLCIIRRLTLGFNLQGKLKCKFIIRTHTFKLWMNDVQQLYCWLSPRLPLSWQPRSVVAIKLHRHGHLAVSRPVNCGLIHIQTLKEMPIEESFRLHWGKPVVTWAVATQHGGSHGWWPPTIASLLNSLFYQTLTHGSRKPCCHPRERSR